MASISEQEFDSLSRYIYEMTGIVLSRDKTYLLETRLQPILRDGGFTTFNELYRAAKGDRSGELPKKIVDAITTNETFFFRDQKPFELLRHKIVPDLVDRRRRAGMVGRVPLRIWSAACSTGQEVYSIAMTLAELLPLREYDIQILGTDISSRALAAASYGQYNAFDVQRGLPEHLKNKYFRAGAAGTLRVRDELRAMVRFESINLLKPLTQLCKFDVIFCRNVAIYFSRSDKVKLFANLAGLLQPDGALILGGSETLTGMESDFVSQSYLQGIYFHLRHFAKADTRPEPPPLAVEPARPMAVPPPLQLKPQPLVKPRPLAPRPLSARSTPLAEGRPSLSPPSGVAEPPAAQEGEPFSPVPEEFAAAKGSLLQGLSRGGSQQTSSSLLSSLHTRKESAGEKTGQTPPAAQSSGSLLARLQEREQAKKGADEPAPHRDSSGEDGAEKE